MAFPFGLGSQNPPQAPPPDTAPGDAKLDAHEVLVFLNTSSGDPASKLLRLRRRAERELGMEVAQSGVEGLPKPVPVSDREASGIDS